MLKILKRLLALSVALAITLSLGIVVSAEVTYSLAADGVMTTVPLTKDNEGSITAASGVTYDNGSVTLTDVSKVSYKLPNADGYAAGTTIYVHITGTNSGSNSERAYLINNSDNCISDILYMPSGKFDVWEEITVNDGKTAKEIIFKGKDGGTNIVDLTITSLEIYVGSAAEYKTAYCVKNGHTYENCVCSVCGDSCTDLLTSGNVTNNSYNSVAITNGTVSLDSNTGWIAVKLDKEYEPGETVTVHISGTISDIGTTGGIRWYLSEGKYGSGNITDPVYIVETSGTFDLDYEFTVKTGTIYSKAVYINIKPISGSSLPTMTITHIGVVSTTAQTEYTITVSECENGSVSADVTAAAEGETVTLTADPDDGYELSEWNVTYGDNNTAVTVADDGTFTMPAGNVTVSATFVEKAAPEEGDLLFDGNITVSSSGSATLANGTLTVEDGTEWIAVKLDQSYAIGETVTIHIAGSSSTMLRWYLSEANTGSGNITTPVYFFEDSSGNFDVTYSFTVEEGLTGSEANYLFIKAPSGSKLSGLTITTLEITENPPEPGTGECNNGCESAIVLSTSNVRDSSKVTLVSGGLNSSASSFELKLPENITEGQTVTVHITGTADSNFRVWLSNSGATASNQVTVTVTNGTFDLTFDLTSTDTANYILFKGIDYKTNLDNLTITHVGITIKQPVEKNTSNSIDGVIYVNENYHGYLVTENGRTHILSAPHNVDANGYCTVCHGYIGTTEEEEEVTVDITEEEVEIIDPQEPGDTDDEDSADSEGEPEATVETNPTTGAMLALVPIAIASLAAISSKKK